MKRKLIILLTTIILSISAFAQLEVKPDSFKEVPGFVNINRDIQSDDNDVPYAVLKVKTENINDKQRRELNFGGDAQTFFETEYKDGEVWLYISYYASFIKISHPDLSSTEFHFPYDMKPKCGYELTLVNTLNYIPTPDKPNFNYLIVKADQPDAMIYFDDVFIGKKEASKLYKYGEKHNWRIDCELYHSANGEVEIVEGEPILIEVPLKPAFGFINVISEPENGAMVFLDGKNVGTTPYQSDMIKSGKHEVKVVKEMYNDASKMISIDDGLTADITLPMSAKFVNATVRTDLESEIYIDNNYVGKGNWEGRLYDGDHIFEAKKASHRTSAKSLTIILGKDETVVIPDPEPIYGSLNVTSIPMGATIIIDSINYGTTPRIINNILIGKHIVNFENKGYKTESKDVFVIENQMVDVDVKMTDTKTVTIQSDEDDDNIYVDDKYIGKSPVTTDVSYGNVKITIEHDGIKEDKVIDVSDETGSIINVAFGANLTIKTVNNKNAKDVIYLDGKKLNSDTEKVSLGKHYIMAQHSGVIRKKTVKIEDNKSKTVTLNTRKRYSVWGAEIGINNNATSIGFVYEWAFRPASGQNNLGGSLSMKTGLMINQINVSPVTYNTVDIPILIKADYSLKNILEVWFGTGPMYSISNGIYKNLSTAIIDDIKELSGLNIQFEVGLRIYVVTLGYTYIIPIQGQKTYTGNSFARGLFMLGLKFGSDWGW